MSTEAIDPRFANYQRSEALSARVDSAKRISFNLGGVEIKPAIVVGKWHNYIVDRLLTGTLETLNEYGCSDADITIVDAPGAYEIPTICKVLAESGNYNLLVTLGAVIKGDTPHFDFVAGECATGLAQVSRDFNLPIGFGVLTTNTVEQALARAEEGEANKGREAVLAALDTLAIIENTKKATK